MCAAALLAAAACTAQAAAPDAIPAVIGWQWSQERPLVEDPLRLLTEPRANVRAEWAPLYRDSRGGRYEWSRAEYAWREESPHGVLGLALFQERVAVRGEERTWRVASDAGGPPRGALLWAGRLGALSLAGAAGAGAAGKPGVSLATSLARGPGWHVDASWSRWPGSGTYDARYADSRVWAGARWIEQRTECAARGPTPAGDVELRVAAIDHVPLDRVTRDTVAPLLGWRSVLVAWAPQVPAGRAHLRYEHGDGRSGFAATRDGAGFASAGGGLGSDLASAEIGPRRGSWKLSGWAGRWQSHPGGSLSTWPFDELTVLTGTRRYASTTAGLRHAGAAVDRARDGSAWEAGVAALHVRPEFAYESWQGSLFGLGRSDVTSGSIDIAGAWLAGVHLALHAPLGPALARVELVQWLPVSVHRHRVPAGGGDPGGGSVAGGGSGGSQTAWGGTVARASLALR